MTSIAFISSINSTVVEVVKLFNLIFRTKVELFYLTDNKEENDKTFKLKRDLYITKFSELISVAHLKDSAYSEIKSIQINLSNNKKFKIEIPDLLF